MQPQRLGEFFNERQRIGVEGMGDLQILDDIEPALARLVFGHEGLGPAQALGELLLRHARCLAHGLKPREQLFVFPQVG